MEWTRDKTLALINEYRKRRGLWDMTHEDYRKKEVKQKLLMEVSNSLGNGISIGEVEKKFHTLRTQYHREINRMKRKEPYNSKWFGFKNLQFLSSPKACRSNKGRIKSEITEEGTVTKYIIRETSVHDTSGGSANSSGNGNEEFYTIHRKPTIVYEAVSTAEAGGGGNVVRTASGSHTLSTSVSRSHELEKLIEETTEDVDDIEEPKPKMAIKEISVPIDQHTYTHEAQLNSTEVSEISGGEQQEALHQQHGHNHNHHQQQETHTQSLDDEDEHVETIDIQGGEEDGTVYQTTSTSTTQIPTRIIKVPRDPCHEETYYDEHQHEGTHHNYTVSAASSNSGSTPAKRIYYEQSGTTILAPMGTAITSSAIVGTGIKMHQPINRNNIQTTQSQQQSSQALSSSQGRDEFSTYGEYVANEMRSITNREILISLKHKINTALFEASMAELQK